VIRLRRTPPQPSNPKSRQKTNSHTQKTKSKSSDPDAEIIQPPPTIIFVRHPKTASYLTILLQHLGIRSTALHSQLSQPARLSSLSLFRAAVVPVLICTDVGARGLDMDDVGMVINWDLPGDEGGAEEYVHRVGRTARMGRGGFAISFVTEREGDDEIVGKIEDRISTYLSLK
jgi:ATP-dependent RNA helicase DDX49/DBP8